MALNVKVSNIVVVHNKGSRSVLSNYGPVSLLSVVRKVLEGIIASNLTLHLESQQAPPQSQAVWLPEGALIR